MNEASYTKEEVERAIEEVLMSTNSKYLPLIHFKMKHLLVLLEYKRMEAALESSKAAQQ